MLLLIIAAGCKKDNYKGAIQGLCPVVLTTDPMDKAINVPLNKVIAVTFNTAMKATTINDTTFKIMQGSTAVPGVITPATNGAVFNFTPNVPLLPFVTYTGTITIAARDTLSSALVSPFIWTFTTMPQITLLVNTLAGGTTTGAGTFAQGSLATVTAIPNTGYAFINWTNNGIIVSTSSSYQFTQNGNITLTANFVKVIPGKFALNLSSLPNIGGTTTGSNTYTVGTTVTASALPNKGYVFSNWTDNGVIVSTSSNYQFVLAGNRTLIGNFKAITGSQLAVILTSNPPEGGMTTGSGSYNSGSSVTVNATPNTGYTFKNWTNGTVIASTSANYTFTLTTSTTLVATFSLIVVQAPIFATFYGGFGGSAGITNQGINTVINNGSIGTTAVATSITGFHDGLTADVYTETTDNKGLVTSGIYAAPPFPGTASKLAIATQFMADATAFYISISPANKPGGTDPGAGELGGLSLAPGVYKSASGTFKIINGDLTLDAKGDPNATWIFQTAAGLTVGIAEPAGARNVSLINGALAQNVYWYVGSSAIINGAGGGTMVGTIIATSGVTFSTAGNTSNGTEWACHFPRFFGYNGKHHHQYSLTDF